MSVRIISQEKLLQDGKGFTYDDFINFNTIIIESETGTGKKHTICEHVNKMIGGEKSTFMLSLTSGRVLADQHMMIMSKQITNKVTVDYRYDQFTYKKNFICHVNYLPIFFNQIKEDLEDCILFIDNISYFCHVLTHDKTIHNVKAVYECVKTLINRCFKVVVTSESEITDNVFELLKNRVLDFEYKKNEKLFIKNLFKPNISKVAKFYKLPNTMIFNDMLDDLDNNKSFLVTCDEKAEAMKIYVFILNHLEYTLFKKEDVLLCTTDDKINLNEIENKIYVYSPSIYSDNTVNFDFPYKSNQYIFLKRNTDTIDLIYQHSLKFRNLNSLHVSYGKLEYEYTKHNTLEKCEKYFLKFKPNKLIKEISYLDENDNKQTTIKIKSSFNKLFIINEFNMDLTKNNIIGEYKNRLVKHGFNIENFE